MLKEKQLDEPKVVEQIQQHPFAKNKKKNTIPEAIILNRERENKQEPLHKITYTGKYGTRPKERPKERNCRYYNAPNANLSHECPARESICHKCKKKSHFAKVCRSEHGKQQKIKEITGPDNTKISDTDKSINILIEIKHVKPTKKMTLR